MNKSAENELQIKVSQLDKYSLIAVDKDNKVQSKTDFSIDYHAGEFQIYINGLYLNESELEHMLNTLKKVKTREGKKK